MDFDANVENRAVFGIRMDALNEISNSKLLMKIKGQIFYGI